MLIPFKMILYYTYTTLTTRIFIFNVNNCMYGSIFRIKIVDIQNVKLMRRFKKLKFIKSEGLVVVVSVDE